VGTHAKSEGRLLGPSCCELLLLRFQQLHKQNSYSAASAHMVHTRYTMLHIPCIISQTTHTHCSSICERTCCTQPDA
jgi:hypothetical protein